MDLLRFLASYVIVFHHLGIAPYYTENGTLGKLPGGALFVEFFFLLSGYFAAKAFSDISKSKERKIFPYMLKKYLHFLPYTLVTAVALYAWKIFSEEHTFQEIIKILFMFPFEAFLMRGTGINGTTYISWFWYLSAMLITLPIILYLIKYHNNIFRYYLVWITPLFIYGYLIKTMNTIRATTWFLGDVRALAGMTLGASLVYITSFINRYRFSVRIKSILTGIELCTMGICFYYCKFDSLAETPYDMVFVLLIYISLAITLSGKSWTSCIHGKLFSFLGKISLPIYCIHPLTYRIIRYFMPSSTLECKLILTVLSSFVGGCLLQAIVDHIILPLAKVVRAKAEACREPELVQSK